MLNSAAESEIDDLGESKLSKVDENSPSNSTDSQQFNSETTDCLVISNELYRIVEALDQEMLDIGSNSTALNAMTSLLLHPLIRFHKFRYMLGRQSHKRVLGDLGTFTLTQDEENIPQAMAIYALHEP
ncbi:hypothetical protein VCV18_001872 [Metarhizium anisopliae]